MSEGNMFEGISGTVEFEIENKEALVEIFNKANQEIIERKKRFKDGTYTEDDLLNHLPRFGLGTKDKIEMYVVESKYFEELANRYTNLKEIERAHKEENGKLRVELEQEKEKNKELEKYEEAYKLLSYGLNNYISKDKIKEKYLVMEQEYARKVYDNNYNRTEVKKEEMYKRQVYEELLEEK